MLTPVIAKQQEYSELFIEKVQQLSTVMPKQLALSIAGISSSAFYEKLYRAKIKCGLSPFDLCLKKHPLQLSFSEVSLIKQLYSIPDYACWPAASIYFEGLIKHKLGVCKNTFYKYVSQLGLKRKWKRKKSKTTGLKAHKPNQYLHVDTTIFEIAPQLKLYIAFVSDNFSKAILGFSISQKNNAENVKSALYKALKKMKKHYPNLICSTIVADGGSENHAVTVNEFLENSQPPQFTKVIALKDIRFSNSHIEAINKIYKRYLRHYQPNTTELLHKVTDFFMNDYNNIRPHISLNGLTPMECYIKPDYQPAFSLQIQQARTKRLIENRNIKCNTCD